jgi:glucose/arabinose dehydrogenase
MIRKLILPALLFAQGLVFVARSNAAVPVFKENPAIEKEEAEYYRIDTFAIPPEIVLEAGALEWMPDGRLAVSTRRGEIYLIANPEAVDLTMARFTRFAHGLHEVLGLAYRDGWLYVTQRGELSRIKDSDGDGKADLFETVSDAWEINGDYHEYAFGSKFDRDGYLWVALCLTGSFTSEGKFRGWGLRITPEGKVIPSCSGIRSPGGIGMNAAGDLFYSENQGPWNGACSLKQLKPGAFLGNPSGNRWYSEAKALGPPPREPTSGSRMAIEAKRIPELLPPAVYFPYPEMGQSTSGIACDTTGGKFGPFPNQLFVADNSSSTINRVDLEVVSGRYQGACIPFRQGFASGNLPLLFSAQGKLFVGGTNRGWGSRGSQPFALQRLEWTGKVPFELETMHARPDGFELTFTAPVDRASAGDVSSYAIATYTYIYQSSYGSPKVDATEPALTTATVAADGRSVRLILGPLVQGHVHELHLPGVRSAGGKPLLHPVVYYTLNEIPDRAPAQ